MIENSKIRSHKFLEGMYGDSYFPTFLVDECKEILLELCERMESEKPTNVAGVHPLTHSATEKLNALEDEFLAAGSEIETAARECLMDDFDFILKAYGWEHLDLDEAVPRDW